LRRSANACSVNDCMVRIRKKNAVCQKSGRSPQATPNPLQPQQRTAGQ
jgi:hypothetical protein